MGAAPDCVFCKIVAGTIPAMTVLDTSHALAFLDIAPLADGHTLLIPKRHYETIGEMSPEELAPVLHDLPRLATAVLSATGAEGYNVLQNNGSVSGQAVPHVHFHIIPRVADDGLGYRWKPKSYATGRAETLHKSIQSAMGV